MIEREWKCKVRKWVVRATEATNGIEDGKMAEQAVDREGQCDGNEYKGEDSSAYSNDHLGASFA